MSIHKFSTSLFFFVISCTLFAREKDLLSGTYTLQELHQLLIPQAEWTPFPKLDDRDGWAKADQGSLQLAIPAAESYLDYKWPTVPATTYRADGWRKYERLLWGTRNVLKSLIMGEIAENKGRFIDQIINGIWAMCEESWWGMPATVPGEYLGMMDVADPIVELWSSETGVLFAWADYFFGEQLDAISPQIRKRIYHEINHRMFKPFMEKDYWWMRFNEDGGGPNNWNPWICSNWINMVLLLMEDDEKRTAMIFRSLQVLDEFLNPYPQDGGCDEGPSYWTGSAGMLQCCFELLNIASNDAFRYVYESEKIKNMAQYIYKAQISSEYYLNFADADPKVNIDVGLAYRFGRDIGDQDMIKYAATYRKPRTPLVSTHFFLNFFALFSHDELQKAPQGLPLPGDVWFPDLQVMIARDKDGSADGFYVAAKGGHNAEAHNHNDVGMFVVYYNGAPLIIDVGRATYTVRTLNNKDKRYELWMHRSDFHNLPTVNGVDQHVDFVYRASDVSYKPDKNKPSLTFDVAKAYPAEAAINKWVRTVQLERRKAVLITDVIDLETAKSISNHLVTCYPVEVKKPGELLIHYAPENGKKIDFVIEYNPRQMEASIEKVKYETEEDTTVERNWGETIHRIVFKVTTPKTKDTFRFRIKPVA